MQLMKRLLFLTTCLLPHSAFALSCLFPNASELKDNYPAAVRGTIVSVKPADDSENHDTTLRPLQRVKIKVEKSYGVDNAKDIAFDLSGEPYDANRFAPGEDYIVFLEKDKDGQFSFPLCGYAIMTSENEVETQAVEKAIGW